MAVLLRYGTDLALALALAPLLYIPSHTVPLCMLLRYGTDLALALKVPSSTLALGFSATLAVVGVGASGVTPSYVSGDGSALRFMAIASGVGLTLLLSNLVVLNFGDGTNRGGAMLLRQVDVVNINNVVFGPNNAGSYDPPRLCPYIYMLSTYCLIYLSTPPTHPPTHHPSPLSGSYGGAVFLQYTVFFLCTLCTFVSNTATVGGGGGLYVYKAPYVHLQTVNFTANQAMPVAQVTNNVP